MSFQSLHSFVYKIHIMSCYVARFWWFTWYLRCQGL